MRTQLDHARMLLAAGGTSGAQRAQRLLDEAGALAAKLRTEAVAAWIEEARRGRSDTPATPTVIGMRRTGAGWRFDYDGVVVDVPHTKGMRYLAELVRCPGVDVSSLVLTRLDHAQPRADTVAPAAAAQAALTERAAHDIGLDMLDPQAIAAFRERVRDCEAELEEARRWNDPERAARLQKELEALRSELSRSVGRHGRARRAGDPAELARQNVTRAIAKARQNLERIDAVLAFEFSGVKTGAACRYEPANPRRPVTWRVELG
jgi:hypothetical protein